jgi:uncharacterized membrane protein YfcA
VIILGALLMGAFVGLLTGMFGVGGGFLITPLLNALLGVPMSIAVGTGVVQILGVSTSGLYRRRHDECIDYKMAIVLFGGNYVGVRLGAELLAWLGRIGMWTIGGQEVPAVDVIVLIIFTVLLFSIAGWLWYDTSRSTNEEETYREGLFSRIRIPPYTNFDLLDRPQMSLPVICYFGLAMGFMTGLLGIGGGVILVPGLIYLVGMRTHKATGTSLAMVWLSSFLATITHAGQGNVDLTLAAPLLIGGTFGLQFGVSVCSRLGGNQLRRYFTLVVLAAALLVGGRLLGMLV